MSTADPFLDLFALPSNDELQQFGFLPTPNTSMAHEVDPVALPPTDPENTGEDAVKEDARKRQQLQPTKLVLL